MRIVLIGQAAFGESVLQELVNRGEEVVAVYTPPDAPGRSNPLKETAHKMGIPVRQPSRMRDPEVYEEFNKFEPDLGVMAFVTDIVPKRILDCPRLRTIQYHPSLLPKHRGGSSINWSVIQGETKTGLTIFWPDEGLDTGPILLQNEVEISPDDTVGSLYYNKLFPLGVEAMMEAIDLIKQENAPKIPQDESQATYEGLCREKDALIDWSQPVKQVYDLIRGTNPQPGATTRFRGKKLKIYDCELLKKPQGRPGEIVEVRDHGFVVAANGGSILVKRIQPEGTAKTPAPEFIKSQKLKVEERLGQAI
ncbi:MAG: methionyl-tRNA formyltransferase [Candidatus Bipolaricaulia bacterium]